MSEQDEQSSELEFLKNWPMFSPPRGPPTWEVPWPDQNASPEFFDWPEFFDGRIGFDAYLPPTPTILVPSPPKFSCAIDSDNAVPSLSPSMPPPPNPEILVRESQIDLIPFERGQGSSGKSVLEGLPNLWSFCSTDGPQLPDLLYEAEKYILALKVQVKVMKRLASMVKVVGPSIHATLERKCRITSVISLECLQQHLGSRWGGAVKGLGVSISTVKLICWQHGIPWPFHKTNTGNCSVFELKLVTESALPNVGETGQLDLSVQSLVEFHDRNNRAHVVTVDQSCLTVSCDSYSEKKKRKYRTKSVISLQDLQQHFGSSRADAAKGLGVSISTVKRICRQHGIPWWPFTKKYNGSCSVLELELVPESALTNAGETVQLDSSEQSLVDQSCPTVSYDCYAEKKNSREIIKRNCRTKRSSISLKDLRQHFGHSRKDAANSFGVSVPTFKRICRDHGILRWPYPRKNNGNCSLFELKLVNATVQDAEDPLNPASSLTVDVGSNHQNEPEGEQNISPTCKTPSIDGQAEIAKMLGHLQEENGYLPDFEGSNWSYPQNGSEEESMKTPTSHDSFPGNYPAMDLLISYTSKESGEAAGGPSELAFQLKESTPSASNPNPNALVFTQPPIIESVGNSKDLRVPSAAEALLWEHVFGSSWTVPICSDPAPRLPHMMPHFTARQDMRTFKATYREDIIKFRLSPTSGFVELKEEVAKRLELQLGSFKVKYEDEDHQWILITCDEDLQDCPKFSSAVGNQVINLLVLDKVTDSRNCRKSCRGLKRKRS